MIPGIGIEPEKISSIFDRFTGRYAYHPAIWRSPGLGLAITKQLIELQGGHIRVKSELNRGTEFNFMIPYKKRSEQLMASHAPSQGRRPSPSAVSGKILIVEDNLINQKLTSTILHHNGFDSKHREEWQEGHRYVERIQP